MANRTESILIKVTPEEKEAIAQCASDYGGSVSDYIRQQSLHPGCDTSCGTKLQAAVRELCRSWELIEKVSDPELRRNFEEWSEAFWQSIK